jgi:arylsulfatase A-like enzyme
MGIARRVAAWPGNRAFIASLAVAFFTASAAAAEPANAPQRPNVLILYADDLGYADLQSTGNDHVHTPNIDSLAHDGVRFANGYVSACVCSPSRAGLLTGRYQQRFGFDANAEGKNVKDRSPRALDKDQVTFPSRLKQLGYKTGLVGKWHLGASAGYLPTERGFDEFYGLLPHGVGTAGKREAVPIFRGTQVVETPEDHTVAFGREAAAFIERHHGEPWFLDAAFTAVHAPHSAPQKYLDRFASLGDKRKQAYYAMIECLDDAIGGILAKVREHGLEQNTLIFFASDNGGPAGEAIDNGPYQGSKWTLWEGGIRSPIFIQWKGHIAGGRELEPMVNQLDWLPTALAAAGVTASPDWQLDGVNLLPLLEGKTNDPPHDALFWRFGVQYAVRQGDWKLVKPSLADQPKLFDLVKDVGEEHDLAAEQPERVKQLQGLWDAWNAGNEPPRWDVPAWNNDGKQAKKAKKAAKKKAT